jgi:FlaA1/EpsC-like NDP-sugar epimerase
MLQALPVNLDLSPLESDLRGRVILLTGAAGSIGSELVRQICRFAPARLILLDGYESDLSFLHSELREAYPSLDLVPVLGDITNAGYLGQAHGQYRPDYVVHAAGYKHVSPVEANVLEAVRNNVLGTLLVATMAVRYGARRFLLVSTNKSTRPSTAIGATRRVAERIVFGLPNLHRSGTDFRAVRFGSLLASNESVHPLLERQLSAGGLPITSTHPLVERYFMSVSEVAQLALLAGSLPEIAGAIAMIEMGEPVRPGEKLREELVSSFEASLPTSNQKIRLSQATETAGPELVQKLSRLLAYLDVGNREGVLATLWELVPECVSPVPESGAPVPAGPRTSGNYVRSWGDLLYPVQSSWPERRKAGLSRRLPPPDPRETERRDGVACRRKTPRVGGRRRTDTGMLSPELAQ